MLHKMYTRYLAGYDTKGLDGTNGPSKSRQDKGGLENKMFQQIMLDFLILVYATHIRNTTCLIFQFDTMVSGLKKRRCLHLFVSFLLMR